MTQKLLACCLLLAPAGLYPALLSGCQAGYLWQQASGLCRVASSSVRIDDALRERIEPAEREKLAWAERVREFARSELGLDPGAAYTTYHDTGGSPISTIVVASHPLALIPYRWHFPIAGTVPYKGYFESAGASRERDRLLEEGWDAVILPVQAFSTLGWFSDPILSNLLGLSRGKLAEVLIHEITHRTIYFPDRSELNESLATVIGETGALRILEEASGAESAEVQRYRREITAEKLYSDILSRLQGDLDALYRSRIPPEAKQKRKRELFSTAIRTLRHAELNPGLEPSNASLVLLRQYRELVPLLQEALSRLGGETRELIARLKELRGSRDPLSDLMSRISNEEGNPCTES